MLTIPSCSGSTGHQQQPERSRRRRCCSGDQGKACALQVLLVIISSTQLKPHCESLCRNSKLTYLLQDALAVDCRTLIYINISQRPSDTQETLACLTFAQRLRRCVYSLQGALKRVLSSCCFHFGSVELGAARKNVRAAESCFEYY